MRVTAAVVARAAARPDDVAVITDRAEITARVLVERIEERAHALRTREPGPHEVVLVRSSDPVEALAATLAAESIGAVPLIGDSRWSREYAARITGELGIPGAVADAAGWAAFSSGSTGTPRVIVRSHDSWFSSFAHVSHMLEVRGGDAVLIPVSLVSSLSAFAAVHALWSGLPVVVPVDGSDNALAAVLPRSTIVHTTPTALMRVVDVIEKGAAHSLRIAFVGGAPLSQAERARAEAHGIRVVMYYGAAELSFVAVENDGSGLRPFPGVRWRVDDLPASGPDTGVGVLSVNSPYLATGYLGAGGPFVIRDGWASVGDLVTVRGGEEPEVLELRGRSDGAIITAGATVIPGDVETVVRGMPGITDAIVFGMPHPRLGAIVCVVVETTGAAGSAEYRQWRVQCRERLSIAQQPRRWFTVEAFARTAAGKPARADVIARVVTGSPGVQRHA